MWPKPRAALHVSFLAFAFVGLCLGQSIPPERPRARPPSELTGWAQWEKAAEIFRKIEVPPAPALSPEEAMKTFRLAPGFRLELVAAEPFVIAPIFFEFDSDGRIWAVEYTGYMRDLEGSDEGEPLCRVVVLEDVDADGRADRSTVFLDKLVMPRSLALVEGGVLIAEPPRLWFCRDLDGDLKCDEKTQVGEFGVAGNPQHTANGLAHGIDNRLHNADWEKQFRFRDGKLTEEPAIYRGQFGVGFDELGRYHTCRESSPVEVDLIPEHYLRRNPAVDRSSAIAVRIARHANECFPIRPTPCITLGALELREDGTLRTYTIVAGTGVYLGDQFPADAYGDVFVPEAGGHLIGRLQVNGDALLSAERHYPAGQEILASTDERFRPMSVRTGPDGALYFADMYRGIIEHVIFLAPYLTGQIRARNLASGADRGRIYRLVSTEKPIDRRPPNMSAMSSARLAEALGHANGWRRMTAQRLLVERSDGAVVPLLKLLMQSSASPLAAMHALWALDGLEALDWATAFAATRHPDPRVRATAVRLAEPRVPADGLKAWLGRCRELPEDPSEIVRLQALLSVGATSSEDALPVMAALLEKGPSSLFHTAALTGLEGREIKFLGHVLEIWRGASDGRRAFLKELSQTVFRSRRPESISQLFEIVSRRDDWVREALLAGLLEAAPANVAGLEPIALPHEPTILSSMRNSDELETREQARHLAEVFAWPGKAIARPTESLAALTSNQQRRFGKGKELYAQTCTACHQPHGGGLAQVAPPLSHSEWVAGPPERLARIVLHGLYGPLRVAGQEWNLAMPGLGESAFRDDEDVAAVLTYVARAWENRADPVDPNMIAKVRAETKGRSLPWTVDELLGLREERDQAIAPNASGDFVLSAKAARCVGKRLAYRPALDVLAPWREEHDIATWTVNASEAGEYLAHVTLAADDASAGDEFFVESEVGRVKGRVKSTGGYERFEEQDVGPLALQKGANRIILRPAGPLKRELADVRGLRLAANKK